MSKSVLQSLLYLTDNPKSSEHSRLCTGPQSDIHKDENIDHCAQRATHGYVGVAAMSKRSVAGCAAQCLQGMRRHLQRLVL